MKNTLRQVFHSSKFVAGFVIFVAILLLIIFYPLFNPGDPLQMIGVGTFAKPGTYVSLYDSVTTDTETLKLPEAADKRLDAVLSTEAGSRWSHGFPRWKWILKDSIMPIRTP